jgi:hypothetical protein
MKTIKAKNEKIRCYNNNHINTVIQCEACGNATNCDNLNPYQCKDYYLAISSNFFIEPFINISEILRFQ